MQTISKKKNLRLPKKVLSSRNLKRFTYLEKQIKPHRITTLES